MNAFAREERQGCMPAAARVDRIADLLLQCTGRKPSCVLCQAHSQDCHYEGSTSDADRSSKLTTHPRPKPRLRPVVKLAEITGFTGSGFTGSGEDADVVAGERRAFQVLKNADHVRLTCQSVGFQVVPSEVLLMATPMYDSVEGYKSLQRVPLGGVLRVEPQRQMTAGCRSKSRAIDPSLDEVQPPSAQGGTSQQSFGRDSDYAGGQQNVVRIPIRVRIQSSSYGTRKARRHWHAQRSTENPYTVPVQPGDAIYDRRILKAIASQWNISYLHDQQFRAILHSYLCWDHPSEALFDEQSFLDGLAFGPSEKFTALLMHSIIAFASKNYRISEPQSVGAIEHDALEEAGRLWGSNERTNSCSDASAGILIYTCMSANGTEESVRYILERALNILQSLETRGEGPRTRQLRIAAWASYSFQTFAMLGIHQPPLRGRPPSISMPEEQRAIDMSDWSPDLALVPPRPGLSSCIASARAHLSIIASRISSLHEEYGGEFSTHEVTAIDLLNRLIMWKNDLKFPLHSLSPASPHLLLLHAQYHQAVIEVCGPLVNNHASDGTRFGDAVMQSISSLHAIAFSYDRQYPGAPVPLAFVAPLLHAVHGAARATRGSGPPIPDAPFFLRLCTALLTRMARSFPVVLQHLAELQKMGMV